MAWLVGRADDELHMGGEGINWVGEAPFVETQHVFQNLGDGTYFHSGTLAVRQAVAAGVNITYKILYNEAVAMTGGQAHDGDLDVAAITHQVRAEGVSRIAVVTDEPDKYRGGPQFASETTIHHRRELMPLQEELRRVPGVSVLVYDQTCAAEKRRKRKRGQYPDPPLRAFINDRVCEGCGDCGQKSNCLSVVPLETEYGRKRSIDQSSCNKDYSCAEGFCPSFVLVKGGALRKGRALAVDSGDHSTLPEPNPAAIGSGEAYRIVIAGVGGTGVVTVGALIGMAARLEGKYASVLDQLGLAQKGGTVISHLRLADTQQALGAVRVNSATADLLLGCDSLVAAGDIALDAVRQGHTRAVINSHETITGAFTQNPDLEFPADTVYARLTELLGLERCDFVGAQRLSNGLLGDSIASNVFLLGFAWQLGLLPIGRDALHRAIEINDVAVDANKRAFEWGRRAAHDPAQVQAQLSSAGGGQNEEQGLEEFIERRASELLCYQNSAYRRRYLATVDKVRSAEQAKVPGQDRLTRAVARNAFKLMAYKDEYEVARLYRDPEFHKKLQQQFEGDFKLQYYLAPPLLARVDPATGEPRKIRFGPWIRPLFGVLTRLRSLRGTWFDPFGHTSERRMERQLVARYERQVHAMAAQLSTGNYEKAVELAELPGKLRGFGHVKDESLRLIQPLVEELEAVFGLEV
jgi:indolepyruvate ferredoxin oxidoreductase